MSVYTRRRRFPYSLIGNEYTTEKRHDEVLVETVDMVNELASGETLSTATFEDAGPTITGTAVAAGRDGTNTAVSFTLTGSGRATLHVTTSAGRTYERRFLWRPSDNDVRDYK